MIGQLVRFGIVGVSAVCVHWLVVAALVPVFDLHPLVANIFGSLSAFQISYWGHRIWTFKARSLLHRQTLPRFIAVACTSFTINETLYFILLRYTSLDYRVALFLILGCVATITFVLSRQWAFRMRKKHDIHNQA
jgi:putative flippase GtrA